MLKEKRKQEEALKGAAKRLEYWRTHREKRGPIPPEILRALKPLTLTYPLSWLTEVLRVNYVTLKKVMRGTSPEIETRPLAKKTLQPTTFVKIPPLVGQLRGDHPFVGSGPGPIPMRIIEFETPQGYKTRFTTALDPTPHIERLLKTLFEFPR